MTKARSLQTLQKTEELGGKGPGAPPSYNQGLFQACLRIINREWEILTPLARGIIGILCPEGVFCGPTAVGPRATENARAAENTNDPEGIGM